MATPRPCPSSFSFCSIFFLPLLLLLLPCCCRAFYVPGVAPTDFRGGEKVEVRAIKMTSARTQLPYDYYRLPFCPSDSGKEYKSENLGEILRGDRIVNTAFDVSMASEKVECKVLCKRSKWSSNDVARAAQMVDDDYFVHLIVDNLPCATQFDMIDQEGNTVKQYEPGFSLGKVFGENESKRSMALNNHLKLILSYHEIDSKTEDDKPLYRVVGFRVEPSSIDVNSGYEIDKEDNSKCIIKSNAKPLILNNRKEEQEMLFTYSVEWERSDILWASRWDIYLSPHDVQIHWFSIVNSVVVVCFLSAILTVIMVRTLRKDIAKYNMAASLIEDATNTSDDVDIDDALEETGWKLVHGDVFRPPTNPKLFCALVGSGIQIFFMTSITLVFAVLGMLSPASRGALLTAAILLFEVLGLAAGYFSGRLYRTLRGKEWKKACLLTAMMFPSLVFVVCFVVNFFLWGQKSSGAIPFFTLVSMMALWFCVSLPLVYLGYFLGYRMAPYSQPVRTNQIPRQIPTVGSQQMWCLLHPWTAPLLAGLLPFAACFIELFFVFSALWENQFYYLFGFLMLVFVILLVSVSQISIVLTYFQLCAEDHSWWWRSLSNAGLGSFIYVLGYSMFYFWTKLNIDGFVATFIYFSYSFLMAVACGLLTGMVAFYASYAFVRKIYAEVKID